MFRRIFLIVAMASLVAIATWAQQSTEGIWRFAVSGGSCNCGNVVMPAIAQRVRGDGASFYWHLGNYRAIYDFDEDFKVGNSTATIIEYEDATWKDFIEQQLEAFGDLPVYLALGDHETIPPKTRAEAIHQFAHWLNASELEKQRLRDNPRDYKSKTYYHWIRRGVDFITLDNASDDQFDVAQLQWFYAAMARDALNPEIRSVVVGMHAALPDSLSAGHSMNDSAQGTGSGREVYQELVEFRKRTHKNVYVLASHSHFFMDDVYNTACRMSHSEDILPGWIVGTAGAARDRLPADVKGAKEAKTDVNGYLLGTVLPDGSIQFQFKEVTETDVTEATHKGYPKPFIQSCFANNSSQYVPEGPQRPPNCP